MFCSCQHRCCLIIILGCKHLYDPRLKIWLEAGKDSRNNQRYININQLHENLGEKLCRTLPAYHALTGCDYTVSFNRKGKIKPLKVLQKNETAMDAFIEIGVAEELKEETCLLIEKYVCAVYGKKNLEDIDEVQTQIFVESIVKEMSMKD